MGSLSSGPPASGSRNGVAAIQREAREIFPETEVPRDFDIIDLRFEERGGPQLIKGGDIDQIKDAMEQSLAPGCQTFEQALYGLYTQGIISLDEALSNADSATNLSWLINNAKGTSPESTRKPTQLDDLSSIRLNI